MAESEATLFMDKEVILNPTYTPSVKHKVYKRSLRSSMWLERLLAYLFLAPSLLLFGIFLFYPLVKSLYLSLYLTDPRGRVSQYVGLDNFTNLLTSELFYKSIQVTLLFILYTVPTGILLALLLAGLAQNKLRGIRIFRFIFSLPMAISVGTGSIIWMILYHPTLGMLNYILSLVNIEPIQWLTD